MKSSAVFSSILGLGLATSQSVTTSIPPATGTELSEEAIVVSGSFDGEMKFFDRSSKPFIQVPAYILTSSLCTDPGFSS